MTRRKRLERLEAKTSPLQERIIVNLLEPGEPLGVPPGTPPNRVWRGMGCIIVLATPPGVIEEKR